MELPGEGLIGSLNLPMALIIADKLNYQTKPGSMPFFSDMKILYHMLVKPVRGDSHAQRMESFYGGQAKNYDDFRRRLLRGREELYQKIEKPAGGVWVDMGGGTGANIENLADGIEKLSKVYVVDLSESLLKVATDRFEQKGWSNAESVCADATKWQPPEGQADVVTCLLYTSPSPRDQRGTRMPSSA